MKKYIVCLFSMVAMMLLGVASAWAQSAEAPNAITVSWSMANDTKAKVDPDLSVVSKVSFDKGNGAGDLSFDGTYTWLSPGKVDGKKDECYLIWTMKMYDGYSFNPNQVSFDVTSTNNKNVTLEVYAIYDDGKEEKPLHQGEPYSFKGNYHFSCNIGDDLEIKKIQLKVYFYGLQNAKKNIGFKGVTIEGTYTGTAPLPPATYDLKISAEYNSKYYSTFYENCAYSLPSGLKAYTGQFNDDKNWLTLTALTNGYIPSNTGVVLEADAADTYSLNIYREEEVMAENNALSGVAQSSPLEEVAGDNDLYILSKQNNVVAFYKYGGANVPAHKAFLLLPKPSDNSNAPAVRMVVETTSIENVTSPDFSTETTIYNLRGQRLQSMQTPGLYIVNGKKVLVK